jgi:amino acid permease
MIAEIVSNGMLSLPSSLAVVGIVPGVILIVFLGVFATFTSVLLIQFKLRHPEGTHEIPFSLLSLLIGAKTLCSP